MQQMPKILPQIYLRLIAIAWYDTIINSYGTKRLGGAHRLFERLQNQGTAGKHDCLKAYLRKIVMVWRHFPISAFICPPCFN